MKRLPAIRCLSLAFLFCACGVDIVEVQVTQAGQAGMASLIFPGMENFSGSLTQALSGKNIDPSRVDSLKVVRGKISMLTQGGLTNDLTFLHDLTFFVQANGKSPELLAGKSSFSIGTRQANLDTTPNFELKPFLDAGGMAVSLDATLNPPPPDRVDLQIDFTMRVDVHVL